MPCFVTTRLPESPALQLAFPVRQHKWQTRNLCCSFSSLSSVFQSLSQSFCLLLFAMFHRFRKLLLSIRHPFQGRPNVIDYGQFIGKKIPGLIRSITSWNASQNRKGSYVLLPTSCHVFSLYERMKKKGFYFTKV
jgi:hypothetical protein